MKGCETCHSIDPAPVKWRKEHLDVDMVWQRIGMDITHYQDRLYLTDQLWPVKIHHKRQLRLQTNESVIRQLEHRAPEELLTDNDSAFHSKLLTDFAEVECSPAFLMHARAFWEWNHGEVPPFHQGHCCKEELLCGGGGVFT